MQTVSYNIEGPLLIKPRVFSDERGYFFESYNEKLFNELLGNYRFVQDNQSLSAKGVLRGLHFQKPPYEQGKLVRVVSGSVLDIAVDIRKSSPTYGQHISVKLTESDQSMFWIPPGFAHGFISLEENTLFLYKCTNLYHKESEDGIIWNDPSLKINWENDLPLVSEKDRELRTFEELVTAF